MKFLIDAGNTMLQSRELSESDPFEEQTNIIIAAVAVGSALTLAAVYFRQNIAQCYTSLFGQSVATSIVV